MNLDRAARRPSTRDPTADSKLEPADRSTVMTMAHGRFALSDRELDARTSLITVDGDLDLSSAPELRWTLLGKLAAGQNRLMLDVSRVRFMDSTALGVLVGVDRSLGDDGKLAIVGAGPPILKLLEVTGLEHTFELFGAVEEALASLEPPMGPLEASIEAGTPLVTSAPADAERLASSVPDAAAEPKIPLSGDAAVALGIAATAMPFAGSVGGEAERWLRILSQYGDAAVILTTLGFVDERSENESSHAIEALPSRAAKPDSVALVTARARVVADHRNVRKVHTTDILAALMDVYGRALEEALQRHGITIADLTDRLEVTPPRSEASQ